MRSSSFGRIISSILPPSPFLFSVIHMVGVSYHCHINYELLLLPRRVCTYYSYRTEPVHSFQPFSNMSTFYGSCHTYNRTDVKSLAKVVFCYFLLASSIRERLKSWIFFNKLLRNQKVFVCGGSSSQKA